MLELVSDALWRGMPTNAYSHQGQSPKGEASLGRGAELAGVTVGRR